VVAIDHRFVATVESAVAIVEASALLGQLDHLHLDRFNERFNGRFTGRFDERFTGRRRWGARKQLAPFGLW
jgi:hypothetical protein